MAETGSVQWHLDQASMCLQDAYDIISGSAVLSQHAGQNRKVWTAGTGKNAWTPVEAAQVEADGLIKVADAHMRVAMLIRECESSA